MSKKNQSNRLTTQQKESKGVVGIFGEEAKTHDMSVREVSHRAMNKLQEKFPQLEFRSRTSIKKERFR